MVTVLSTGARACAATAASIFEVRAALSNEKRGAIETPCIARRTSATAPLDDRPGATHTQRFVDHRVDLGAPREFRERDRRVAGGRPDDDTALTKVTERDGQRGRRVRAVEP